MQDKNTLNDYATKCAGFLVSQGVKRKDITRVEHIIGGRGTILTFYANVRYDELTQPEQYEYIVPSMEFGKLKALMRFVSVKMDQLEK